MDVLQPAAENGVFPLGAHLTRPLLESLSTGELVKLADSYGLDIPFALERVFIIEELLDLSLDDEFDQDEFGYHPDFLEAAALPKQYNISFIDVMIRDPLWAFVCWEINGHDKEIYANAPNFEGYCLRVIPLRESEDRGNSFTVTLGPEDTAWYLGFPPDSASSVLSRSYQVELCAVRGTEEIALARSRPFRMPGLIEAPYHCGVPAERSSGRFHDLYQNPLACLSGAHDFSVIRNADRRCRTRV